MVKDFPEIFDDMNSTIGELREALPATMEGFARMGIALQSVYLGVVMPALHRIRKRRSIMVQAGRSFWICSAWRFTWVAALPRLMAHRR
jgi:hypothetical protein